MERRGDSSRKKETGTYKRQREKDEGRGIGNFIRNVMSRKEKEGKTDRKRERKRKKQPHSKTRREAEVEEARKTEGDRKLGRSKEIDRKRKKKRETLSSQDISYKACPVLQ